jgi:D-alanyl-D-alanine carboxypeptidase/D-alanyl-D-alanine-endopeptidase (penicillin-binding protein 4)
MKHLRYLFILLVVFTLPTYAQVELENIEDDDDSNVADSAMIDTLQNDSVALPWPQGIQQKLAKLVKSDMFKTSQLGMMVYDLDADSTIFAFNDKQLMRPASTMKLITAITAIDKLGGDYQFKTELCYTGKIENHTLKGDVYCVGGFDPRFNSDDLNAFVEAIRKMGVDTIVGTLYGDKSMKDNKPFGEGWCWDDDNNVLSPLIISRKDIFMGRFFQELQDNKIVINDATIDEGRKPAEAYCIVNRFHTLDQILMRMLKESDNLYAEAMYYQIAASTGNHPASAKSARAVERRLVEKIGLNPSQYKFADGSGLSLYNYVSAELEVKMLRYAFQNDNIYNHLFQALPIAGVDGTLKKRMHGSFTNGNVRAKTGTVTGISSLAGYCKAANGHRLCFSIINQGLLHGRNGRAFQDRVCTVLCSPN